MLELDWKTLVETGWGLKKDENRLIDYFEGIHNQHPSARAKFELANVLDYLGRESEAIPLYQEAISEGLSTEYHVYALVQMASSLRNVGRANEAVEVLTKAEKKFPEFASLSLFLGLCLHSDGRHTDALKTVMTAMLRHVHSEDLIRYAGITNYIEDIK